MRTPVLMRTLHDLARSLAWWALGLVGLAGMMVGVYPSVRDNPAVSSIAENYPEALQELFSFGGGFDYSSPAGYLGIELFSLMVPLLLIIAAVATGAGGIAGEEDRGTMELLLANPVTRRRIVLEKGAAMAVESVLLGAVLWAALAIGAALIGMEVSAWRIAAAVTAAVLLAAAFGAIALLAGAVLGRRGPAVGVTAALAVAAYLVNSLAGLVTALEPLRPLTPFFHYEDPDPLRTGFAWGHLAVLAAIALVAAGAAAVAVTGILRDSGSDGFGIVTRSTP